MATPSSTFFKEEATARVLAGKDASLIASSKARFAPFRAPATDTDDAVGVEVDEADDVCNATAADARATASCTLRMPSERGNSKIWNAPKPPTSAPSFDAAPWFPEADEVVVEDDAEPEEAEADALADPEALAPALKEDDDPDDAEGVEGVLLPLLLDAALLPLLLAALLAVEDEPPLSPVPPADNTEKEVDDDDADAAKVVAAVLARAVAWATAAKRAGTMCAFESPRAEAVRAAA